MLIGAHVSPSGGLWKAIERGSELGCRSIQIFNQSPRMWRPTAYAEDAVQRFLAARADSEIDAVLIHAVYLLNCASDDGDIVEKTLASLVQSLSVGEAIGADAVVLHPGSAKTGDVRKAIARAGKVIGEALKRTGSCALHLENTAGAGGTLGRSFDELADLIDAAGGSERLGVCLDSCHLLASGMEIRDERSLTDTVDACIAAVGPERIGSLHLNDSQTPLGSNRDRHANIGEGELGLDGCALFLSEPRFESLPCVLETPGHDRSGPTREEVALCVDLRERGLAARAGANGGSSRARKATRTRG